MRLSRKLRNQPRPDLRKGDRSSIAQGLRARRVWRNAYPRAARPRTHDRARTNRPSRHRNEHLGNRAPPTNRWCHRSARRSRALLGGRRTGNSRGRPHRCWGRMDRTRCSAGAGLPACTRCRWVEDPCSRHRWAAYGYRPHRPSRHGWSCRRPSCHRDQLRSTGRPWRTGRHLRGCVTSSHHSRTPWRALARSSQPQSRSCTRAWPGNHSLLGATFQPLSAIQRLLWMTLGKMRHQTLKHEACSPAVAASCSWPSA